MVKRIVKIGVGLVVVALAGTAILGTTFWNLVTTGRQRLDHAVNEYVDPEVAFAAAAHQAEVEIPRRVATLRQCRTSAESQLAQQTQLVEQERKASALVNDDLQALAPVLVAGKGQFELRARKFNSPDEVRTEVERLLRKRDVFQQQIKAREAVVAGLIKTRAEITEQLRTAQDALATYQADSSKVKARIELVKAGERIEALQSSLRGEGSGSANVASGLQQLDERLQVKLYEQEERARLRAGATTDSHVEAVRAADVLEECRKLTANTRAEKKEAGK